MATAAEQSQFTSLLSPLASQIAAATGDSQQEILGQLALESGWGQRNVGTNNPGSIMLPGTQTLANYSSLGAFASSYESALQQDGMTGYADNTAGFAQAASAYDPGNADYSSELASTIASVPSQSTGVQVQVGDTGMNSFLPVLSSNDSGGNATTAPICVTGTGQSATGTTKSGSGCNFSVLDLPSWLQCEGFNLLFLFLGVLIIGAIIMRQLGMEADDVVKMLPVPPVE